MVVHKEKEERKDSVQITLKMPVELQKELEAIMEIQKGWMSQQEIIRLAISEYVERFKESRHGTGSLKIKK